MPFAHSANASGRRHDLVDHLTAVSKLTARFARGLGAEQVGRFLGLWHDIGKFDPAFQEYLRACERDAAPSRRGTDHKGAGALLAAQHADVAALVIQGHHGGLRAPAEVKAWLAERRKDPAVRLAVEEARAAVPDVEPPNRLALPGYAGHDAMAAELLVRLLFSALVDADFLDTERHFSPSSAAARGGGTALSDLWERFERDQERLTGQGADHLQAVPSVAAAFSRDLGAEQLGYYLGLSYNPGEFHAVSCARHPVKGGMACASWPQKLCDAWRRRKPRQRRDSRDQ